MFSPDCQLHSAITLKYTLILSQQLFYRLKPTIKNRYWIEEFLEKNIVIMSFKKIEKKAKKSTSGGGRNTSGTSGVSPPSSNLVAVSSSQPGPGGGSGLLPEGTRSKLWELFGQIEHEFESLYSENAALRERVERLEQLMAERSSMEITHEPMSAESPALPQPVAVASTGGGTSSSGTTPLRKIKIKNSGQTITKRLKRTAPSKKGRSGVIAECSQVCIYSGHRDGVWQVAHARNGLPVIGTASADGTACVWDVDSSNLLLKYVGHSGSVNSISFHPHEPLACTGSGDNSTHVWNCSVSVPCRQRNSAVMEKMKHDSSGEDRCISDEDLEPSVSDPAPTVTMVKAPLLTFSAHKGPVMSCDWLSNGQKLVTASWDHTAKLWDFKTAQVIHSLEGHDQELTHVCAHPSQELLVTSSLDATFRLWDFRAPPIHSVNVFQGHSKAVNSAVFSLSDNVVSGSDDHTLKIWDLRNMRSPMDSVRLDCGVNRLAVSHDDRGILAVPLDNRHIKLYDLKGSRLAHSSKNSRTGHHRMVYSVAWSPDNLMTSQKCNLFSAGFDNRVIGWKITV